MHTPSVFKITVANQGKDLTTTVGWPVMTFVLSAVAFRKDKQAVLLPHFKKDTTEQEWVQRRVMKVSRKKLLYVKRLKKSVWLILKRRWERENIRKVYKIINGMKKVEAGEIVQLPFGRSFSLKNADLIWLKYCNFVLFQWTVSVNPLPPTQKYSLKVETSFSTFSGWNHRIFQLFRLFWIKVT